MSLSFVSAAQEGLVSHLDFRDCLVEDITGNNPGMITGVAAECDCGLQGNALFFDGNAQFVRFKDTSNVEQLFTRLPFTISFNFRPVGNAGQMVLISKRESCLSENGFSIKYNAATRDIHVELAESATNALRMTARLPNDRCWHTILLSRIGTTVRLYANGVLLREMSSSVTINLRNNRQLEIGTGPCVGTTDVRFSGYLEDLRFYNRDLSNLEVEGLFRSHDKIFNRDTTIYLGGEVQVMPGPNCADGFSWLPGLGVSDPTISGPVLRPQETTTYYVNFNYSGCVARDTLVITVIDPAELDCAQLPMPNAFTPNGDGTNERYIISNPYTFDELISFEIFDRNGSKVFVAADKLDGWDGNFSGKAMPPGAYLFMIRFRCQGSERAKTGSFHLIR